MKAEKEIGWPISSQRRNFTVPWESCTAPKMIPNRPRNDPYFSSSRPRNDPQLLFGMEWYSATELFQVCCSVYPLETHKTFHYSLCDF